MGNYFNKIKLKMQVPVQVVSLQNLNGFLHNGETVNNIKTMDAWGRFDRITNKNGQTETELSPWGVNNVTYKDLQLQDLGFFSSLVHDAEKVGSEVAHVAEKIDPKHAAMIAKINSKADNVANKVNSVVKQVAGKKAMIILI